MEFSKAAELLKGVPFISSENARRLYDFVVSTGVQDVLELGFAHGTSTCYIAAALDEVGSGSITTMDKLAARDLAPNLDELLARTRLTRFVTPVYCEVSYTWELMRLIERQTGGGVCRPTFDFCFIDGAHTWDADGFAFFLADKLLRPGGWLLFDDLHWRHADNPSELEKPWIKRLPNDMKTTAHIAKVFGLLVSQHERYSDIRVEGEWGWARKIAGDQTSAVGPDVLDQIYGRPHRVAERLLRRNRAR